MKEINIKADLQPYILQKATAILSALLRSVRYRDALTWYGRKMAYVVVAPFNPNKQTMN